MDTAWFAVDRCGHVALFSCGALGKLPREAVVLGADPELSEMIFGPGEPDAAAAGLHHYRHGPGDRYVRDSSPAAPVRLDDLPERVEAALRRFRFGDLCFLDATELRPEDHADCVAPPRARGRGWLRRWFGGTS